MKGTLSFPFVSSDSFPEFKEVLQSLDVRRDIYPVVHTENIEIRVNIYDNLTNKMKVIQK